MDLTQGAGARRRSRSAERPGLQMPHRVETLWEARSLDQLAEWTLFLYIASLVMDGLLRWALVAVNLQNLVYLRDLALFLVIMLYALHQARHGYFSGVFAAFIALLALHVPIGLFTTGSLVQVAFGLKILMNVLAGACMAGALFRPSRGMIIAVAILWFLAVVGIVLDGALLDWPWKGLSYDVGDVEVEASRDWSGDGIERASGFSRFSISAGLQVMLLSLFLMVHLKGRLLPLLVVLISIPALLYTTAKGTLVSYAVVVAVFALWSGRTTAGFKVASILVMLLAVILPVWASGAQLGGGQGLFSLESMAQRVGEVWPAGWSLIFDHGAGLLGRGIGGIGSPQRLFAPMLYNPADNLFIFMFAYFGILSLAYLGIVAVRILRLPSAPDARVRLVLCYMLYFLLYGVVVSVVEDAIGALVLGATLHALFNAPKLAFLGAPSPRRGVA